MKNNFYEKVYNIVKQIPKGKVTSYGHIALLLGSLKAARAVGYALNKIPLSMYNEIPWHRVINSKGKISIRNIPGSDIIQKELLEKEGVIFDENGKTDLSLFGWLEI